MECTARFSVASGMEVTCIVNNDFTGSGITSIRYNVNDQGEEEGKDCQLLTSCSHNHSCSDVSRLATPLETDSCYILDLLVYFYTVSYTPLWLTSTASSVPTFVIGTDKFRNGRNRVVVDITHSVYGSARVPMDIDLNIPSTPPPPRMYTTLRQSNTNTV